MPSTPANIPMARKMTKMGIPRREESELSRMLAATNRAPTKKSVLIVLASKMPSPANAPIKPDEVSMPLTRVLIYQEKVIVAEGIFRYLLFELCGKKTMLKPEPIESDIGTGLQFATRKRNL